MVADFYWLSAIQYVGENALSSAYKKYLYEMLNLVTDLSPAFEYPYEIGLLLLPEVNPRYEKLSETEIQANIEKAVKLGEKGLKYSCDPKKTAAILSETELSKIWTEEKYADPCGNAMIPYYLAYVEYWNRKNADKASDYYRIAAANRDAPKGARIMSAIMRGKSGNREKSILMFLSIAESLEGEKRNLCKEASGELRDVLMRGFSQGEGEISGAFMKEVERVRKDVVGELNETANAGDMDSMCSTYLGKAVRELNLEYLSRKEKAFVAKGGKPVSDAKELFDAGGADYFPRDFQKLDEGLEIIYVKEDGDWDYVAGNY